MCENRGTVKEACGVFGIYAPERKVANLTFDGLFALQHRAQIQISDSRQRDLFAHTGFTKNIRRTNSSILRIRPRLSIERQRILVVERDHRIAREAQHEVA